MATFSFEDITIFTTVVSVCPSLLQSVQVLCLCFDKCCLLSVTVAVTQPLAALLQSTRAADGSILVKGVCSVLWEMVVALKSQCIIFNR